jgi:hypothetical protein
MTGSRVGRGEAGRLKGLVADLERALDEVHHHAVELIGGEPLRELQHLALGRLADGGDPDLGHPVTAHVDLGLLARLLQHLQAKLVPAQIELVLLEEVVGEPAHDAVVEVVAAEVGITSRG